MFWKLFLFALIIVAIAMAAIAIKLFFTKNDTVPPMGCKASSGLSDKGIGCACSLDENAGCQTQA
ncbi:MAG: hypothetical protein K9I34_00035 [Bacteroidales bacterium]|nr:hypothetical protein [Bacteroidales bacterium]